MLPVVLSTTAEETFVSLQAQIFERLGSQAAEQFQENTFQFLELPGVNLVCSTS